MTDLFNACLRLAYFPKKWRKAIVIPKEGKDDSRPDNLRPITLLSATSKVFERLVQRRVREHLTNCDVLVPEQFGFSVGHSTTHQPVSYTHLNEIQESLGSWGRLAHRRCLLLGGAYFHFHYIKGLGLFRLYLAVIGCKNAPLIKTKTTSFTVLLTFVVCKCSSVHVSCLVL